MNIFDLSAKLTLDSSEYTQGLANAERDATSFSGKLKSGVAAAAKAGTMALAAATTAVVGFGASSVKTGANFDEAMAQVAATMGTTVDKIQELRDFAQDMGATTVFSATQSAEALNYMALAGYDANKSMTMLPNVLNLAAAGSIDLARASDMVTDAESALGLSTQEVNAMVDQMAKTASKSNTSVEQLGEAILTIGGTAQFMAGGTDRLQTVLGLLADNGIKGSEAGTHLRNMLLKLSSPTTEGAAAIEELGLQVYDSEGKMRDMKAIMLDLNTAMSDMTDEQKVKTISALFNARDVAAVNALLNTTEDRWNELGSAIKDADGAAKAMAATQLDNLAGDVTLFKSALEGAQIAISDSLTPTIREFVQIGTSGLSEFASAFKENGLAGALEALGNFLSNAVNKIIEKLPVIVNAASRLIIAFVQGILANMPAILDAAIQTVTTLVSGLSAMLPELIPVAVQAILTLVETLTNSSNLLMLIDAAVELIIALSDGIIRALPILIQEAPVIINNLVSAILLLLPTLLEVGLKLVIGIAGGIIANLPEIVKAAVLIIPKFIGAVMQNISQLAGVGKQIVNGVWQGIQSNAGQFMANVKKFFTGIVDGVKRALGIHSPSKVFANIGEFMAKGLDEGFSDEFDKVKGNITSSLDFTSTVSTPSATSSVPVSSPITINVYATENQNVNELADEIERRFVNKMRRSGAVYA